MGVGTCSVTAHQTGGGPVYDAANPVTRTFQVTPAPVGIKVLDKTKTYGSPNPVFTARFDLLRNGDTADDFTGLVLTGPPANSPAGTYDIVGSGASNPNYTVTYAKGHLKVEKAPLTITPDDQTRVYGADRPAYTAGIDGLVNGDTTADIPGCRRDVAVDQSVEARGVRRLVAAINPRLVLGGDRQRRLLDLETALGVQDRVVRFDASKPTMS